METGSEVPIDLEPRARRRAMLGIFSSIAVAAIGYIPALSIAPLVADALLGSARWSGLPAAVTIAGAAVGTTLLSRVMARRTRRFGLNLGFAVVSFAAGFAACAVAFGSFGWFLVAMALFGGGNGARHLSRYAAGDLYAIEFRGRAIATVVWAGTIGSVLGPLLLAPSQALAQSFGADGYVGPYVLAMVAGVVSLLLLVGLVPHLPKAASREQAGARTSLPELLRWPKVWFAFIAMAVGHFVMVLIMSMTALHIHAAGGGLRTIGLVFSAHTMGMFGLSPITGILSDRWGRFPVIVSGQIMLLVAALMAIPTHGSQTPVLMGALFLLGLGWNFGFVAGSTLLTESIAPAHHLRLQGAADAFTWTVAAASSLLSGFVMTAFGFMALGVLGAVAMSLILVVAIRNRGALSAPRLPPGS
ncbi:MAG: MFS transporter [Thermoanaerobaculia bacterium]